MRLRALLVILAVASIAPGARASEVCGPAPVCGAVASVNRQTLPMSDLGALSRAHGVGSAVRAADPAAPSVRLAATSLPAELAWWSAQLGRATPAIPVLDPHVERGLAWMLAGARQAEIVRATALHLTTSEQRALGDALYAPSSQARLHADSPRLRALAGALDVDALRRSAAYIAEGIDRARLELAPLVAADTMCGEAPSAPVEIGDMIALDTDGVATRYVKPYALTVDLGGCDTYDTAAGASGLAGEPLGLTLDLGGGDDRYANAPDSFGLGAAEAGLAALVDDGGNDTYEAAGLSALGSAAVGGVGLLADLGGDDSYDYAGSGGGYGAEGSATIGYGTMIDLAGDDRYSYTFDPGTAPAGFSRLLSMQGGGVVGGVGILADASGDDRYEVHTVGNAVSSEGQGCGDFAGVGVLADGAGNDVYTMDGQPSSATGTAGGGVLGQGSGTFDGSALLLDGGGNDAYTLQTQTVAPRGASASAIGQGFGEGVLYWVGAAALVDLGGNDTYDSVARATSSEKPSNTFATVLAQGYGDYEGTGALLDLGGDDAYATQTQAANAVAYAQGAGLGAGGVGLLLDASGNDRYESGPSSQGFGADLDFGDGFDIPGGTGVVVDGGGANAFSSVEPGTWLWQRGRNGVGVGVDGGAAAGRADQLVGYIRSLFGI